jgi:hypothetical protein
MLLHYISLSVVAAAALLPSVAESCLHDHHSAPTNIGVRRRNANSTIPVRTALTNVRIWDGSGILQPSTITLDNGFIVPNTLRSDMVIDGQGGVLLPGFIDSHAHPESINALEDLSSYGVTTVLGMACSSYDICNGLRNHAGLTQYFSSGIAAHAAGGLSPGPASFTNGTSQAGAFVDYVFGNGSDYLKIVNALGGPDQATQNAMVAVAHAKGKSTMTHATQRSFFESAIVSKTDIIQHAPADLNLSKNMIDLMVQQKQSVTPTMEIARIVTTIAKSNSSILAFLGESHNASYTTWRSNVMAMHAAGIPILAGTDAAPQIPLPFSPFGWTFHQELANLVDAGLSTTEALRSATIVPATLHKLPGRGKIAVGMRADLVLLSPGADPERNISATKDISRIWIGGLEYAGVATQPFPSFP